MSGYSLMLEFLFPLLFKRETGADLYCRYSWEPKNILERTALFG